MRNASVECLLWLVLCWHHCRPSQAELATVVAADDAVCPDSCQCGNIGDVQEIICDVLGYAVTINLKKDVYLYVNCDHDADWNALPHVLPYKDVSVQYFTLVDCAVAGSLLLPGLRSTAVRHLRLLQVPTTPPTAEQLALFEGLISLEITLTAPAVHISPDLLASLPSLQSLRLWGAPLPSLRSPSLTSLEVSDCPEPLHLAAGQFAGLPSLRRLLLYSARVRSMHENAMAGLSQLAVLDFTGNLLEEIPPRALHHVPLLTNLSLSANPLRSLPSALFSNLSHLQEFRLRNIRENLSLTGGVFSRLSALIALELSGPGLITMEGKLVEGCRQLKHFRLSGTKVTRLDDDLFLELSELRTLDLSNNLLETLSQRMFSKLSRLEELNLDGNRIREFPSNMCGNMSSLRTLSARDCDLSVIHENALTGARNLGVLLLSNNSLRLESASATDAELSQWGALSPFQGLLGLHTLELQHNHYTELAYDWRSSLLQLRMLNLSHNRITDLQFADINFLSPDVVVDLRYNDIGRLDLSLASLLSDDTPADGRPLILLGDNPFRCDCDLYTLLVDLAKDADDRRPVRLSLGDARCASPPSFAGRAVLSVTSRELSCVVEAPLCPADCVCTVRPAEPPPHALCPVAALHSWPAGTAPLVVTLRVPAPKALVVPELGEGPVSLSVAGLALDSFQLTHDSPETLQNVDLRNNSLATLNEDTLNRLLTGGRRLQLSGNPWWCGCGSAHLLAFLTAHSGQITDWGDVRCAGDGEPLSRATGSCWRLAAMAAGAGSALVALVLASLLVWRRKRAAARERAEVARAEAVAAAECRYDVFVSHAHSDERWAWAELIPRLERAGLRVCVHSRDWVVGEPIPQQIARSVAASRRTLLLLSRHFIQSSWSLLEFRTALARSGSLLAVLLEPVKELQPPSDLATWLASTTYLPREDPDFWEKLLKALPKPVPSVPPLLCDHKIRY